ncbi:class I SAM-dependent DNA methyltransferase [Flaviflexus huanghaiensis]|uniref:class I SAM-dependent DNA methyltransferase n=1 Tax=Flaviflexus huanghaiensis TaxID=1111473 RepID=UPI0015FB5ADA|nr:class I SAM-dependent methyltransferase [Flaviflexus huanghaiensis]
MSTPETNVWAAVTARNPEHSANYAERWRNLERMGRDIHGEARLVDAMVDRGAAILDAGCGTGRVGGNLAGRGHRVVGVDLDPYLIEVARADHPLAEWHVGNLADFTLASQTFDHIVSAGNVMTFLAGNERIPALRRLGDHLAPGGRMTIGFGSGRGYEFDDFEDDLSGAGLAMQSRYSSWQLDPPNDNFLIAVITAR